MKKLFKDLKSGTIIRLIVQLLTYINNAIIIIAQTTGKCDNKVYLWVSFALTVIVTGASYWYDNDWSSLAKLTGKVYDAAKDGNISEDELNDLLNKESKESNT